MSAYVEIKTVYQDKEALLTALQAVPNRLGRPWTLDDFELHDEAQPLRGYMGDTRKQKANIIIRKEKVQRSANDIGFELMPDGSYQAHISDFDSGFYSPAWRQKLNVEYGTAFVEKKAKAKGYRMSKEVQEDGSVKMKLSRWK